MKIGVLGSFWYQCSPLYFWSIEPSLGATTNYTRLLVALTNHKNGDIRRKIVLRVSIAGKHKRVSRDALLPGRF